MQAVVWAVGDEALVGMGLLENHEVRLQVRPGGTVQISPLR